MSRTSTALRDSDIVIIVIGFGGSRRSSFINALLGEDSGRKMPVGVTPERACTTNVDHVVIDPVPSDGGTRKNYRLVLVDTPGLDASNRPDSKVYGQIADWSNSKRSQEGRAGVIFLHDLTCDRFEGECHHTTAIGQHLNIAVVTSKWDYCQDPPGEATRRHGIVKKSWTQPRKRATFHAFQDKSDAWEVVQMLLSKIEADRGARVDLRSVFEELKAHWELNEGNYETKKSPWKRFLGIFGFGKSEGGENGTRKKKKAQKRN